MKSFHSFLYVAISQAGLRYAMGVKMIQKSKSIISWFLCIFFFILFLGTITESISWLFFLGLTALFCPLVMKYLNKINKKPKVKIRIATAIVLFILSVAFMPPAEPENTQKNVTKTESQTSVSGNEKGKDSKDSAANTEKSGSSRNLDEKASTSLNNTSKTTKTNDTSNTIASEESKATTVSNNSTDSSSKMYVHFIDVEQGDAILVESAGHFMLIDAGENNMGYTVVNYLNSQGVKKLDYVIGTHPHSDHIGGLDTVIDSFEISKIILPDVTHTSDTFEDVIDAIRNNNLKITKSTVGKTYTLGDSTFTIVAPNGTGYDDLNNYSVGIKLTNGNDSFLMAGDAEALSEREMLHNGIDLSADVLKLGHHGSSYSSSNSFLDAVDPSYAVISVGEGNQYGHPHSETLQEMADRDIKVYRTDRQGNIVFTSDGKNITVDTKPSTITKADLSNYKEESNNDSRSSTSSDKSITSDSSSSKLPISKSSSKSEEIIVHVTESGGKYHNAGCRYLKSDIKISLKEALSQGLEPCKVCNPPTE